jgi:hypothetical protein
MDNRPVTITVDRKDDLIIAARCGRRREGRYQSPQVFPRKTDDWLIALPRRQLTACY